MPDEQNKADQKARDAREAEERRRDNERLEKALENPRGFFRRRGHR